MALIKQQYVHASATNRQLKRHRALIWSVMVLPRRRIIVVEVVRQNAAWDKIVISSNSFSAWGVNPSVQLQWYPVWFASIVNSWS
jgi:hypothetical protein